MGKKSRNKKSKQNHNKPQQSAPRVVAGIEPASLSGVATEPVVQPQVNRNATVLDIQTQYIRSDITRILLLLVIIMLMLGGLFLTNHKTTYLKRAGQRVTTFLQL